MMKNLYLHCLFPLSTVLLVKGVRCQNHHDSNIPNRMMLLVRSDEDRLYHRSLKSNQQLSKKSTKSSGSHKKISKSSSLRSSSKSSKKGAGYHEPIKDSEDTPKVPIPLPSHDGDDGLGASDEDDKEEEPDDEKTSTISPTGMPTVHRTRKPTVPPTRTPTILPTGIPTSPPTRAPPPTGMPTHPPSTGAPTSSPTCLECDDIGLRATRFSTYHNANSNGVPHGSTMFIGLTVITISLAIIASLAFYLVRSMQFFRKASESYKIRVGWGNLSPFDDSSDDENVENVQNNGD